MPEVHFQLLKRKEVKELIGKQQVETLVFYLVRWEDHLEREISWHHTSVMGNMGRFLKNFNDSLRENQISLPYIKKQYYEKGFELLRMLDVETIKQKLAWKIEKILGKRYINHKIHYFIKWKHTSIFESDWITADGLCRLYPDELKECKKNHLIASNKPFTDGQSIKEFIENEKTALEMDKDALKSLYEKAMRIKREKLEANPYLKPQEIRVQTEFSPQDCQKALNEMITDLNQRIFNPFQELYIKHMKGQASMKREKIEFEETYESSNTWEQQSNQKDQKAESEITMNPESKRIRITNKRRGKNQQREVINLEELVSEKEEQKGATEQQLEEIQQGNQQVDSYEEVLRNLLPAENFIKLEGDSMSSKRKKSKNEKPEKKNKKKQIQISIHEISSSQYQPEQSDNGINHQKEVPKIEISLFQENTQKVLFYKKKGQKPQIENLYKVITNKGLETNQQFLLGSDLTKTYPKEFIKYLEKENAKLRAIIKENDIDC